MRFTVYRYYDVVLYVNNPLLGIAPQLYVFEETYYTFGNIVGVSSVDYETGKYIYTDIK